MVPVKKEDLRKLVTDTTVEIYEELTPQLEYEIGRASCRERV